MSEQSKHTPGPWKVSPSTEADFLGVYPDTGRSEFPVAKLPEYIKAEIAEANARLIAAAPDLLAELKWCMIGVGNRTRMAAAIAKAEGKS